jgi:FKBP-type peptidyl-prolyl cis-trans isomerase
MRTVIIIVGFAASLGATSSSAFSLLSMKADSAATSAAAAAATSATGRRAFFAKTLTQVATTGAVLGGGLLSPQIASAATAAPEVKKTESGKIKYAILKSPSGDQNSALPQKGDIAAIEYTGYLTSGQIFDGTHAEGKKNILVFTVGGNAVIDGINEMVLEMRVGEKVQAIIPPELAFKDKGVCLPSGECLIKPGDTLVYDIALKRVAIPPP